MKKVMALFILAGSSMFAATHFSFGVNVGGFRPGYYAPRPVYVPAPVYAAPAYVDPYYAPVYVQPPVYGNPAGGYWSYPGYGRRVWVNGYYRRPAPVYRYERFNRFRR